MSCCWFHLAPLWNLKPPGSGPRLAREFCLLTLLTTSSRHHFADEVDEAERTSSSLRVPLPSHRSLPTCFCWLWWDKQRSSCRISGFSLECSLWVWVFCFSLTGSSLPQPDTSHFLIAVHHESTSLRSQFIQYVLGEIQGGKERRVRDTETP